MEDTKTINIIEKSNINSDIKNHKLAFLYLFIIHFNIGYFFVNIVSPYLFIKNITIKYIIIFIKHNIPSKLKEAIVIIY